MVAFFLSKEELQRKEEKKFQFKAKGILTHERKKQEMELLVDECKELQRILELNSKHLLSG